MDKCHCKPGFTEQYDLSGAQSTPNLQNPQVVELTGPRTANPCVPKNWSCQRAAHHWGSPFPLSGTWPRLRIGAALANGNRQYNQNQRAPAELATVS